MISWRQQGAAYVAAVQLKDGRTAKVVLVAGRANPRGAVVVATDSQGAAAPIPLMECLELLTPAQVIQILSKQLKAFDGGVPYLQELM